MLKALKHSLKQLLNLKDNSTRQLNSILIFRVSVAEDLFVCPES